jgi:hypothetical protein
VTANIAGVLSESARRIPVRAVLVAYGVAFALFSIVHLNSELPNQATLMATRTDGVSASIAVLDAGGPPLLGAHGQYGAPGAKASRDYFPVGTADDQGIYLYLPLIGHATGERDPHVLLNWFFIGCFALLFLVYPVLIYELFGSFLAAIAAPAIVLHWFAFLRNSDLYWIVGWGLLLGLPIVLVAYVRPWGKTAIGLLVASGLLASFCTSVRIHSGLPIVIAAVAVAAIRAPSWRSRLLVCLAVVAMSYSIDVGVFSAVRLARDEIVGVPFRKEYPTEHPTWHNAYIGLGYLPNKYGITWNDQVSIDTVNRIDPHAGYLTPRYEHILRHLWFKLLRNDPSFVLGTLWTKFGVCIRDAIHRFGWLWPFLLAFPLLLGRRVARMRWALLLTAPALALTVIPPVVTVPEESYEDGFLTAVGLLWMLLILWAIASAPDLVRWVQRRRLERPLTAVSRHELVVTAACLVALVAVTWPAVVHARTALADAAYTADAAKLVSPPLRGRAVQEWAFAGSLPAGWQQFHGTIVRANGDGVRIDTAPSAADNEVSSPTVTLPPGRYTVATAGIVERGGIGVGVFDLRAGQWLATSKYWSGQSFADRLMVTRFVLKKTTQAEVLLTNWAPSEARPARWTITDVRLLMDAS